MGSAADYLTRWRSAINSVTSNRQNDFLSKRKLSLPWHEILNLSVCPSSQILRTPPKLSTVQFEATRLHLSQLFTSLLGIQTVPLWMMILIKIHISFRFSVTIMGTSNCWRWKLINWRTLHGVICSFRLSRSIIWRGEKFANGVETVGIVKAVGALRLGVTTAP